MAQGQTFLLVFRFSHVATVSPILQIRSSIPAIYFLILVTGSVVKQQPVTATSWYSVVDTVTMLRLATEESWFGCREGWRHFSLLQSIQTHTASYTMATGVFPPPGIKRRRREASHSPSPTAQDKWSYAYIRLLGVDRDNFTFTFSEVNKRCLAR